MNQAETKRRQVETFSIILALITLAVVTRTTGENGVSYLAVAVEITATAWILGSGCTSDMLGKLLRIRNSKGQYKNALKLKKSVMLFQIIISAAGCLLVFVLAGLLTEGLFKQQYGTLLLMALAPILFLRSVSAVLLGYFQGEGAEFPTAASSVLRQLLILGLGLLFGKMLGNYGDKVSRLLQQDNFSAMYGGIGVAIAISLTELIIVLFLFLIYRRVKQPKTVWQDDGMRFADSFFDGIRVFSVSRGARMGIQLLAFLPFPVGLLLLQRLSGDGNMASREYGAFLSGYAVVCGVITALIFIALIPLAGKIFVHLRKDEHRYARMVFQGGTHLCIVYGVFSAVCVAVLASQAAALISPEQSGIVEKMFVGGAPVILFLPLSLYFSRLLVLTDRKGFVLGALVICNVVFGISAAAFISTGKLGAVSLAYSGSAGCGVLCLLLGVLAYKQTRCRLDWLNVLVIPIGAACVAGGIVMLLAKLLTPHVGNLVTIILTVTAGGLVEWLILLFLRNFSEQELDVIPGGRIMYTLGQLFHVY